jgi:hypothetical protein
MIIVRQAISLGPPNTYRLEPDDNPGGDPKVILRTASELR